jgi:hypothetical protein
MPKMQKQWQKGISALKTVNMFIYCGQNEAQNLWFAEASLRKVCEKQIVRAEIRVKKLPKAGSAAKCGKWSRIALVRAFIKISKFRIERKNVDGVTQSVGRGS